MTHTTISYRSGRRARMLRPAFGFAAACTTAATLALAVVAPMSAAPAAADRAAVAAAAATEVAILPGTIEVVATRTKVARARSGYVPAAYRPRG